MKNAVAAGCLVSLLLVAGCASAPAKNPPPPPQVDAATAKTVRDRCSEFIPKYWYNKGKTAKGNLGLSAAFKFTGEVGRYTSRIRDDLHISFTMLESGLPYLCSVKVSDGQVSIGRLSMQPTPGY
jgi:hypothetical protein